MLNGDGIISLLMLHRLPLVSFGLSFGTIGMYSKKNQAKVGAYGEHWGKRFLHMDLLDIY